MAQDKPRHNPKVIEHLVAQVLDHGQKLQPLVDLLNAGELEGFPAYPISYSTAHKYVARARRERDAATPLSDTELDRFYRRLWAVTLGELRKVERDARKPGSVDLKRINGLEETATRLRRHLAGRDKPQEPEKGKTAPDRPPSLLHTLAAQEPAEPKPAAA